MSIATHAVQAGKPTPLEAAREAALKARRIQSAGRWYLLLIGRSAAYPLMGLAMLVGSSLVPLPPAASVLLMIGLVTLGLAVRKHIDRARERAIARGVPNLSWPPLPSWFSTAAIAATVAFFACAGVLMWFDYSLDLDTEKTWPIAVANLLPTAGLCWYAWRIQLWEYALVALSPAVVITLCLVKDYAQLGDEVLPPMIIAMAIPLLIAGIFLRRRWRAFVAALPKEDAA